MGTAAVEADTYIDSFNNTSNFVTDATALVGSVSTQFLRGLFRFALADLPGSVTQFELVFDLASFFGAARPVYDFHALDYSGLAGEWVDAEIDWDEYQTSLSWGTAGGDYLVTPVASWDSTGKSTGLNRVAISQLVSAARLAGDTNLTVLAKKQTETGTGYLTINTEDGTGGPYIEWLDNDADNDGLRYRRNFQRDLHNRLWPRKHF